MTDEIHCFYTNPKPDCHWRTVRRQSRAWAKRDKMLVDMYHEMNEARIKQYGAEAGMTNWPRYDLSPDAPNIIITDCIDAKRKKCMARGPASDLQTALVRHLSSYLPSIAFRTNGAGWHSLHDTGMPSMLRSVDALNSGCPVVFLDVRTRLPCNGTTRAEIIAAAKKQQLEMLEALLAKNNADNLQCCNVAFFYDVLFGDGDARTTTGQHGGSSDGGRPRPIHEVLHSRRLRAGHVESMTEQSRGTRTTADELKPATREEIIDVAQFLADARAFHEWKLYQILDDGRKREELTKEEWSENSQEWRGSAAQIMYMLLSHDAFHGSNVADLDGVRRLVQTLVLNDRLPKENTTETLELLQQAWCEHDVAVLLAKRYIRLASALYALILLVGVAIVACTTVFADISPADASQPHPLAPIEPQHIIFGLSMLNSILLVAVKFFNPTIRGNQLRASASTLESIIWLFRTRVGSFAVPPNQPDHPTAALRVAMTAWHAGVVGGTDLLQTSLERHHPPSVYTHGQFGGTLQQSGHHGPSMGNARAIEVELTRLNEQITACRAKRDAFASASASETGRVVGTVTGAGAASLGTPEWGAGVLPEAESAMPQAGATSEAYEANEAELKRMLAARASAEAHHADMCFVDDHQSPVKPGQYVQLRLLQKREEYRHAIPRCYRWRRFWELILTICTVASASLSYAGSSAASYVAVSSATAAAVTSWGSFDELAKRIERYSNAVRGINELVWWWKSLTDSERALNANITKLIEHGESLLSTERLAWLAAVQRDQDGKPEPGSNDKRERSQTGGRARVAPE